MILCQDNLGKELRADGEDYCWLQQVFSSLVIAPSSAGAVNGKSKLSLEVMSPWENQVVTFRFGPHEQRIELPPASAGLWTTVSVDLPREALKDGRGIFVELAEVHSPRAWGLSADPRHLGLAIRRFSLS
jgi:hypothetical protein